jgi:Na+/proline symporter/signal transduction histidine kinase
VTAPLLALLSALYLGVLFFIAWQGDRKPVGQYSRHQPLLFSLSLAVYCSSWTFYGAVGTAAHQGWTFVSIYLGPLLLFLFGQRLLGKVVRIAKRKRTTSIADFIATRHGNSQSVAALVTLLALIGTIPYIALQLKAVSATFNQLAAVDVAHNSGALTDTALYVSLILALFSILFGARRIDATEHHRGMIQAVSFESLIKLVALCCVAIFAWASLSEQLVSNPLAADDRSLAIFDQLRINGNFFTTTLLAACAMLCLPRQFQVLAVESRGDELKTARWAFSGYLLLTSLAVLPITLFGLYSYGGPAGGDMFVLSLPMAAGEAGGGQLLATFVYIGGLSAATGMVIVATIALSTMISNDLALPLVLKYSNRQRDDFYPLLLALRRTAIVTIMLLAFIYYRATAGHGALATIGLLAFAAAAQIAPAMIGGLYWRRGHRHGALVAIAIGSLLWLYTLMVPIFSAVGWIDSALVESGPWAIHWLRPTALFGYSFGDQLTHGVFWSLTINALCYWFFSNRARPNLTDRLQAASFIEGSERTSGHHDSHQITVGDIRELSRRFVGTDRTARFFEQLDGRTRRDLNSPASPELLKQAEQLLASSIGSSSARNIIETAIRVSSDQPTADLLDVLDQTSAAIQFNRELLQATLDNISQGVSAIDKELNLVAWNRPYLDMFAYPDGFIKVGMPISEVIALNLERGMIGDGDLNREVERRLMHMRNGTSYAAERIWAGRVLRFEGNPMPDGGYVTTFTDITDLVDAQRELEQSNQTLEVQVAERTESLSAANAALRAATREAESATLSKTRFLAAASHDLLQPLNAGKLFIGALQEPGEDPLTPHRAQYANRAMASLQSAEALLKALLDISKLDAGALQPTVSDFNIEQVLAPLGSEFSAIASDKGLQLKINSAPLMVRSDPQLLRSILQNFIANAVRYTKAGRVLIACRPRANYLLVQVRDSGPGIAKDQQRVIFDEFHRIENSAGDTQGLGLGLAITERIANLLGHCVTVRSAPGRGSTFSVAVPLGSGTASAAPAATGAVSHGWLRGLRVLCVDDQPAIVEASEALLGSWGAEVRGATSYDAAEQLLASGEPFDLVLADYRLDSGLTGLALLRHYCGPMADHARPGGAIISAEQAVEIAEATEEAGFYFVAKPVDPVELRALLEALQRMRRAG